MQRIRGMHKHRHLVETAVIREAQVQFEMSLAETMYDAH